jgi:hypothetical protein
MTRTSDEPGSEKQNCRKRRKSAIILGMKWKAMFTEIWIIIEGSSFSKVILSYKGVNDIDRHTSLQIITKQSFLTLISSCFLSISSISIFTSLWNS